METQNGLLLFNEVSPHIKIKLLASLLVITWRLCGLCVSLISDQ